MTFGIKTIARFLRLFRRREDGGPSVEFVLVFLPFFVLSVSGFEMGLMMTRHAMLERGVDMAVRAVRLNSGAPIDETQFKTMICNGAGLLEECMSKVRLEMISVDPFAQSSVGTSSMPREASCTDVSNPFLPSRAFTNGSANEIMVVRACGLFRPMLPEFGLGYFLSRMRADRFYPLVTTSAFVMEPV